MTRRYEAAERMLASEDAIEGPRAFAEKRKPQLEGALTQAHSRGGAARRTLRSTPMAQPLPLTGIRVVDYSHFLAGPHCGRNLAALGAEVIKVERPKAGDAGRQHAAFVGGQSGYFLQQNMGKQGLCINLKDPRGLAMMHKLTDTADVFLENYRPGALNKLGLGYAELSERNPRLVYCSISAYGHTGPDSHRSGFGLIAEAKSGIMQMVGTPGEAPPLLRIALGDMYTGTYAVAAICAALLGRVKSERGQHIDMALYDCLVSMHEYAVQATPCRAARWCRSKPVTTCRSRRCTASSPRPTATS